MTYQGRYRAFVLVSVSELVSNVVEIYDFYFYMSSKDDLYVAHLRVMFYSLIRGVQFLTLLIRYHGEKWVGTKVLMERPLEILISRSSKSRVRPMSVVSPWPCSSFENLPWRYRSLRQDSSRNFIPVHILLSSSRH